jgi:hemerythrin-like domain-containing protein
MLDATKGIAMHGYSEHMAAEGLLRMLQVKDATNMDWKATARKLKEALQHHIQEEESTMFEAGRQLFTREEAEMMGEAFEKMKPEVREEGFMKTTIDMMANLMPPRLRDSFTHSQN